MLAIVTAYTGLHAIDRARNRTTAAVTLYQGRRGPGGMLREIRLRIEFCANMRSLVLSSPDTELSRVLFHKKAEWRSTENFLRVQCNMNVILQMMMW